MGGNSPFEIEEINPIYQTDTEHLMQIEAIFSELLALFEDV